MRNQLLLRGLRNKAQLRKQLRRIKGEIKKADEKSHRETFAARTVRDRVRVGDFESAFLQVLAVIED